MTPEAAVWLSQLVKKPLLKLTDEDYNEHGLQDLDHSGLFVELAARNGLH